MSNNHIGLEPLFAQPLAVLQAVFSSDNFGFEVLDPGVDLLRCASVSGVGPYLNAGLDPGFPAFKRNSNNPVPSRDQSRCKVLELARKILMDKKEVQSGAALGSISAELRGVLVLG